MAPGADPAFQQAMDKLMLQVNRDNVLAAHRAFRDHADELRTYLYQASLNVNFGRCGGDPVSADAAGPQSFGGKIAQLFEVHWKHWEELDAVAARLKDAAHAYGHTEDEISRSLSGGSSR